MNRYLHGIQIRNRFFYKLFKVLVIMKWFLTEVLRNTSQYNLHSNEKYEHTGDCLVLDT